MQNLIDQIDEARPGKFHLLLMILAGSCWMWAAYGVTIIGFLLPALKTEWNISADQLGWLASIGMMGMLVGSITLGKLSDKLGRRRMLSVTMIYLACLFILSAYAWSYTVLLVLRFFLGFGLGAILPSAGTLVTEFSPSKYRGMMMVLLNGFWGLGGTLAALIGFSLVLHYRWRISMFFGSLSLISGVLIWKYLPESFRYLVLHEKNAQIVQELQRMGDSQPIIDEKASIQADTTSKPSAANQEGVWSSRFARITSALWILWISLNFLYQGVFIWLPTLLGKGTNAASHSFLLTILISLGQIPGTIIVALLADRKNRTTLVLVSLGLLAGATILFGLSDQSAWVIILGILIMVFNGMAWGLAHPYSSELYPTRLRGTATGMATGIGRLGGVVAPLVVSWLLHRDASISIIFVVLASAPLIAMIVLSGIRQNTTRRSLEEISGN